MCFRYFFLFIFVGFKSSICVDPNQHLHGPCLDSTEFQCSGSELCIPAYWKCDGYPDCDDSSDEKACPDVECQDSEFRCSTGKQCIPLKWRCDGEKDCKDNSDEDPDLCDRECVADAFTCRNGLNSTRCISLSWICDGDEDCDDGSDELNCNPSCTTEQFSCKSGKCISLMWKCDGDLDCEKNDTSDEDGCPVIPCTAKQFECSDGSCIDIEWVCDGASDCPNGSDEFNCRYNNFTCMEGEVPCEGGYACVRMEFLCDGQLDCPSGDDESKKYCGHSCPDEHFMCGDYSCIDKSLVCNGFPECVDASDEANCSSRSLCNKETEFNCGDICIPWELVCNGQEDCANGSDEPKNGQCEKNECKEHNGGCSQNCIDTKTGHYCTCTKGFMLINETLCEDIDECHEPGICSQICVNLKGGYKCECVSGYSRDPHNYNRCKANEGHASLLFAHFRDIRKISLDHHEITAIVNRTSGSAALDFVFKTGMIFWADAKEKTIYKAPIDEGSKKQVVVSQDVTNADGLAIDWIYNHLYWTNADKDAIEVADFNGDMRKTLITDRLEEPRAISLYPLEGWMFWTDWGIFPKIERGGMDGSHRQTIVDGDIKWPNALTLDYVLRKIYWADSKLNTISSANFDGSDRRVILNSKEYLPHPFSITLFEDTMYWSDWTREAIMRANKFSGKDIVVIASSHATPMTVHVYHSYRQPNGTNHCTPLNGLCSHLCLPAPFIDSKPRITCACPDELELAADGFTCEDPSVFALDVIASSAQNAKHVSEKLESTTAGHISIADSGSISKDDTSVEPISSEDGSIAVPAILAALLVICVASATTTEDGFNMSGAQRGGMNGPLRNSQTQYQHRQYGINSAEESLMPLTLNHQQFV